MSKRGGYPGGMGNFGGINRNQLMKEAKKIQADIEKSQEELTNKTFENTVGGGAVTAIVTGDKKITSIKIKKDVVDPEDIETLEDLVMTCINGAMTKVDNATAESFGKYNIPGLM